MLGGHSCTLDLRVRSNPKGFILLLGHRTFPCISWQLLGLAAEPLWDSSFACGILRVGLCVELCGSAPAKRSCFFNFLSLL